METVVRVKSARISESFCRSSGPEGHLKKVFLKISQNSQKNVHAGVTFNKITGQPRRFPVNFTKALFTLYEKF